MVGFRSNTAPKLIDVADCFIDLGEIAEKVRKDFAHGMKYEERELHVSQQPPPPASFIAPPPLTPPCAASAEIPEPDVHAFHPPIGSIMDAGSDDGLDQFGPVSDFIRVTDDQ